MTATAGSRPEVPKPEIRRFEVRSEDRLDRAVSIAVPSLSRTQARHWVEEGRVRVDGAPVTKASTLVVAGQIVEIESPAAPAIDTRASEVPLAVLYEDEHTLILNKQPGLVVHPAEGLDEVTLIEAVAARYPEVREIDDSDRGGIVHRLDRDTSGVIALAKSAEAQFVLKEQFRLRETTKAYLALVEGRPDPAEGIIDAPLGPDPAAPYRRAVVEHGQSAKSQYRVLEQYGDEAALLEVRIFTGRTHQIRVHLAAVGHPVLGDTLYGHASAIIPRQALHAWRLGVTLASNGAWREFVAPPPDDLRAAVRELRVRHPVRPAPEIGAIA
ncbi:MAG: RluA family pseudouridine synthase [Dehalococcoidia bacterium]|nr:MAG: RluA family pseudouridine synthase [Dehalococcoidia bacterium]